MAALKFGVIRQSVTVDAAPAEVYEAYVDAKKHSEFTGSTAAGAAKEGGSFSAWDGYITGRFLKLDKGRKVVQEWRTTEWPEGYPPSVLELTFSKKGAKTELRMVHSKVPAEQVERYREGWVDSYWNPLKEYFKRKG